MEPYVASVYASVNPALSKCKNENSRTWGSRYRTLCHLSYNQIDVQNLKERENYHSRIKQKYKEDVCVCEIFFKKKRSGEMAQPLRTLAAIAENGGSSPGTHLMLLTTVVNHNSRESSVLF